MTYKFLNKITFFLFFTILAAATFEAAAATHTVSTTLDTDDGVCDRVCSLREAIAVSADNDVVEFHPNLVGKTVTLSGGFSSHHAIQISQNITINGLDGVKISGGGQTQIFSVVNGAVVTMKNLDIGNAYVGLEPHPFTGTGAAIYIMQASLTIEDSYIHNNVASVSAGAIFVANGELKINNTLFAANSAQNGAGAIYGLDSLIEINNSKFNLNSSNGNGGAMFLRDCRLTMTKTNAYKNSAVKGGVLYISDYSGDGDADTVTTIRDSSLFQNGADHGGAIYNTGGTLNLINSTFSTNKAKIGDGGALVNEATALIRNATFALNSASGNGGAIFSKAGSINFGNTIVAGNTDADNSAPNIRGMMISAGYNLVGPTTGSAILGNQAGNQLNVADPMLMPLGYNGATTLNHLPMAGSPVINAGDNLLAVDENNLALPTDQRGIVRIFGGAVDIGAVEMSN